MVILAHVGSAHTDAELGILLEQARAIVAGEQDVARYRGAGTLRPGSPMCRIGEPDADRWPPAAPTGAPVGAGAHCGDQFAAALRRARRGL